MDTGYSFFTGDIFSVAPMIMLQVSAFGSDEESDDGDAWVVVWDKGPKEWLQDQKVTHQTCFDSIQPGIVACDHLTIW